MARKKIREYDAKRLLKSHLQRLTGTTLPVVVAQVNASTDYEALLASNPWLTQAPLVVKPDMLFGQRGKHDLVGLKMDFHTAIQFVKERLNRVITVNGCTGPITTFIIEPFLPHTHEFYLSILSTRLGWEINFSQAGGIHIEENWDKLQAVQVETAESVNASSIAPLLAGLPLEVRPQIETFILNCFKVFEDLDMTMLEMNPFTLDSAYQPVPLDIRMELDDTAAFRTSEKWGDVEFPLPFGRILAPAEEYIHTLDASTGASLKFTVLNPKGSVWLMVAGGGASVIYTDTVGDLGYASELGNYGEYSGGPNTKETYLYAGTVLDCVLASADGSKRALLIGGGIANFTDVAATFTGIINAIRERAGQLKAANVRIFVRRGGPNYQRGLKLMRDLGTELDLAVQVYGPESSMTGICQEAIQYLTDSKASSSA